MTASQANEQQKQEPVETNEKQPYEPPTVHSESLFETAAVGQGKLAQDVGFTCDFAGS